MDSIALVVCTYSRERLGLLEGLLASVAAGSRQPDEIIVVVDREPELEQELAGRAAQLGVRVLGSPTGGLSAARNVGWNATQRPWVAFVDDDAIVAPDWLALLLEGIESTDASIVGGRVDPLWGPGGPPDWYTDRLGWLVGCTFDGFPERIAPVRSVIGCNMAMERRVLRDLDGFAADLGREGGALIGSEETELCMRATKVGESIWFLPDARAWQVVPPARRGLGYARRRAIGEGRSKARLATTHGSVLGMESRYARDLVTDSVRRIGTGLLRRPPGTVRRGAAQIGILGITTLAYGVERLRLVIRRRRSTSGSPAR